MNKKKIKGIHIDVKRPIIEGKRKIGIDANLIISLIHEPEALSYLNSIIKEISKFIYTHKICIGEAKKILIRDFKYKQEMAIKEVDNFIKKYKIKVIPRLKINNKLAKHYFEICQNQGINLHRPDNFILADFKKRGINQVYTQDDDFMDACNFVGISACRLLEVKSEDEEKIRKFFKDLRKIQRRFRKR